MAGENDIQTHQATYHKMIGWMKYGVVIVAAITALVIFLITRK
ncbi:aa3-type cytochrome c oxidase subunit IV [Sphingomonas sp. MMS24-J45]